eukprot:scaffold13644_cov116-Skeletonema_dohrnii-CCMP3373.AAC.1
MSLQTFNTPPHTRLSDEIRARASRTTPNAQADNELLYKILVESFVGLMLHPKLRTSSKREMALASGKDCKRRNALMTTTRKLLMPTSTTYALLNGTVRNQEYSDRTRVGWLLAGITSKDTQLCIRINNIEDDDTYMDDWEKTAIYLAKTDYEGKNSKGKRKARFAEGDVSGVRGNPNGGGGG